MSKIKYLFKRILKMNYKKFFDTINLVHKRSGKNRIVIFFDIIVCGFKYQAGYMDYNLFEMYNMNSKERKTVITRGINNSFIKKYNDQSQIYKFEDKVEFNKIFDKYLNREWIYLKEASLDDFKKYIKGKKEIIVKPVDASCGTGIEIIDPSKRDPKELYDTLINNKQFLVEDVVKQNKEISNIYPNSVNTLRVVTINKKVVAAYLRIGNKGNVVDNFNHGGMATKVNIENGIIEYPAIDKNSEVYTIHPETKHKIVGVQVPMWDKVVELCETIALVIPEVGYVGWDICVGEDKLYLIEGNDFPGHDIYQLPVHRSDNYGDLPIFEKAMKEGEK